MITLLLVSTIMFMIMKHPLSMGMNLLMQIIIITLITGNTINFWWFSYITFLIMIGGMMVLFIYMTSIASNEKFKMNFKLPLVILMVSVINTNLMNYKMKINETLIYEEPIISITKFFCFPSNLIMAMMIIYLLITLIAVVKIVSIKTGPLRSN
uniref:NADH-ubiquinone oxidoreductase chain 6 n=1 Tax=Scydmaeninae sp. 840218 TaxID=1213605 RepID=A0A0S2MPE8_9COLE|nr:NADH deshydrogenase subunit 6 [Scydmaeninae sp. 840218]